jgi:hypothetical protein
MNSINYLEQAKLADSLGKYKLADSFYEKAVRLAGPTPPVNPIITEGLESITREAIEAAARAIATGSETEVKAALMRLGLSEAEVEAIAKRTPGGIKNINLNVLIGGAESAASKTRSAIIIKNLDGTDSIIKTSDLNKTLFERYLALSEDRLSLAERNKLLRAYRNWLKRNNSETVSDEFADEVGRQFANPRPEPTRPPAPESETPRPSETPLEELPEGEVGEGLFEKIKSRLRRKPSEEPTELPKQKSKVMKWAKIVGATGLAALGLFLYKDKLVDKNGKEINYFDIDLNKLGLSDDTMYKDRTEAGQQQAQEPKALAFIQKHKDNPAIKDQRDWYNLALQESKKEGNDPKTVKNFANDVIAIIKKSDPKTQGFDAGRNA